MDTNRRHYTQMTQPEISAVLSDVKSKNYQVSNHAVDRMRGRRVTDSQITGMLNYCSVIEVHNNIASEIRVLVRGKVQGNYLCAVVSLTTNKIVTVYWNDGNDNHKTLDKTQYSAKFDYFQLRETIIH